MKRTNKKGFTLVELVIVIAIIAILAAVLIPTFSGVVKKANESKALQEAKNAYTEVIAECLANDGQVSTADTRTTDPAITVAANATDSTKFDITFSGYTFTVDANGALSAVAVDGAAYTFTVVNGTITAAKKA